jgi:hypothetical protein
LQTIVSDDRWDRAAAILVRLESGNAEAPRPLEMYCGAVVYDALIRTLSAKLANPITSCREVAESGPMAGVVTCTSGNNFLNQLIETAGVRRLQLHHAGCVTCEPCDCRAPLRGGHVWFKLKAP